MQKPDAVRNAIEFAQQFGEVYFVMRVERLDDRSSPYSIARRGDLDAEYLAHDDTDVVAAAYPDGRLDERRGGRHHVAAR